ncbi:MAG: polymerase sigma factor RpoE [Myxococcaceae bacterium]|nr:polymerase sigma factor RpoE [Myxococcaceae bacterium]
MQEPEADIDEERGAYTPALVERCRRGDRAALSHVFRREMPYLERVLFRVLGPSSDLEDQLQLTLEQAIHAFPAFRGEAAIRTWLTRIAVRSALHHLKHPAQRRRVSLELIEGGRAGVASSQPEREADARARLRLLYEHLDKLDPKHRTAFVLYQVEGRSMEEVAALMDAGLSATKSRVMWARRKLFARLEKDPRTRAWVGELAARATIEGDEA